MNKENVNETSEIADDIIEKKITLNLPVFEMEHEEYIKTLQSKWFSDEFYELLSKHKFSILLKNIQTGEETALQTFGARFPLITSIIA